MKEQDIITLDNNKEYLLIDELAREEKQYFFAVEVINGNVCKTDSYIFLEAGEDEMGEYIEEVTDEKLFKELLLAELTREVTDEYPEIRQEIESMIEEDSN